MSEANDIRRRILQKMQESNEAAKETVAKEEPPEITTAETLGCKVSYNDMFDVACETVGLKNFSLDEYIDALPVWTEDQKKLIPEVDPNYKEQPEILWMLVYCIINDELALLQGFQGTGKTSGIEYVCAKMSLPLMRINCTSTQDSSSIAGSMQVVNEGGVPVTKYNKDTDFIKNMQAGVICLMDEIFFAPDDLRGGTLMRFRDKPIKGNRVLTAPEDTSGTQGVPVHAASRLFYADNTLGLGDNADKFSARFVADTAFLDGINFVIKVDYLPEEDEINLLKAKVPGLKQVQARKFVQLAKLVRRGFENGDLPITMSLRTLRPVAEQTILLGNPIKALKFGFYNKLAEESERDIFKEMLNNVAFGAEFGNIDK